MCLYGIPANKKSFKRGEVPNKSLTKEEYAELPFKVGGNQLWFKAYIGPGAPTGRPNTRYVTQVNSLIFKSDNSLSYSLLRVVRYDLLSKLFVISKDIVNKM